MVTLLKMFTNTRKRVISKAILPGMTSGGTTKLIHETTTKSPEKRMKHGRVNNFSASVRRACGGRAASLWRACGDIKVFLDLTICVFAKVRFS